MTKSIIYVADDGKEFKNESECYFYDWRLKVKKIQGKLKIYDYNFSPMDIEKKPDSGEIAYIRADTDEAVDFMKKWFREEGYCAHIDNTGFWYYDDSGNWLDLEKTTEHFIQTLRIMQQDKMLDD
jgi:hypothetical protein